MPTNRAPMAAPSTTCAAAISSPGGCAATTPLRCSAALSTKGPTSWAAGTRSDLAAG